jgi:hypothetical protein
MAEQKAKKRRQKLRKNQIDLDEYLLPFFMIGGREGVVYLFLPKPEQQKISDAGLNIFTLL